MRYYVWIEGDAHPLAAYATLEAAIERARECRGTDRYGDRHVAVNDDAGWEHWTSR